ncbi:MAG: hypothetical protein OEZ02_02625 [Anaerolineae bacterium]|nr:hypothetical protein [Anaerolineae bacterium]
MPAPSFVDSQIQDQFALESLKRKITPTQTQTPPATPFPTPTPTPVSPSLLASAVTPPSQIEFEFLGQVGGLSEAVAVHGEYVFLGVGPRIWVFDLSNPKNLKLVGQSEVLSGYLREIIVQDQLAYVLAGDHAMAVLDITDPRTLTVVAELSSLDNFDHLIINGEYAYMAGAGHTSTDDGQDLLTTVKLSNQHSLAIVNQIVLPTNITNIKIWGQYAYFTGSNNIFYIYNLTDPEKPVEVSQVDTGEYLGNFALTEGYTYIYSGGLTIIDIRSPQNPVVIRSKSKLIWSTRVVAIEGNLAYFVDQFCDVCGCATTLNIVDISDPGNPQVIGELNGVLSGISDLVVSDGFIFYIATGNCSNRGGFQVIDVRDPSNPRIVYTQYATGISNIALSDGYIYSASWSEILTIDVRQPSNSTVVGKLDMPSTTHEIILENGYAYLTSWPYGLFIVDIRYPRNLRIMSHLDGWYDQSSLAVDDGILCILDFNFSAVDVSNPLDPHKLGSVELRFGSGSPVATRWGFAYVAGYKFWVINIDDPDTPVLVSDIKTNWDGLDIDFLGSYLVVAAGKDGLRIMDISDPGHPVEFGHLPVEGGAYALSVIDNLVFVASGEGGVLVFDFSNPSAVHQVGHYDGLANDILLAGDRLYIGNWETGLTILRWSIP